MNVKQSSHQVTLGQVEHVAIPSMGIDDVIAKVDTGAFSGAIHCTDIQLSDNAKELSFNPLGDPGLRVTVRDFNVNLVRSTSGHKASRYLVPIDIIIQGAPYQTMIGLVDRSDMSREMLIGRRFLMQHDMLVDVSKNSEYDEEWKRASE